MSGTNIQAQFGADANSGKEPDKDPISADNPEMEDARPPNPDPASPSIIEQLRGTFDESKEWLTSELAFQKLRLRDGGQRVKTISILFVICALLLICAFITLLLGIFLTVAVYIGPVAALLGVPFAYALIAFIIFRLAMSKIRNLKSVIDENGGITGLKIGASKTDDPKAEMAAEAEAMRSETL